MGYCIQLNTQQTFSDLKDLQNVDPSIRQVKAKGSKPTVFEVNLPIRVLRGARKLPGMVVVFNINKNDITVHMYIVTLVLNTVGLVEHAKVMLKKPADNMRVGLFSDPADLPRLNMGGRVFLGVRITAVKSVKLVAYAGFPDLFEVDDTTYDLKQCSQRHLLEALVGLVSPSFDVMEDPGLFRVVFEDMQNRFLKTYAEAFPDAQAAMMSVTPKVNSVRLGEKRRRLVRKGEQFVEPVRTGQDIYRQAFISLYHRNAATLGLKLGNGEVIEGENNVDTPSYYPGEESALKELGEELCDEPEQYDDSEDCDTLAKTKQVRDLMVFRRDLLKCLEDCYTASVARDNVGKEKRVLAKLQLKD